MAMELIGTVRATSSTTTITFNNIPAGNDLIAYMSVGSSGGGTYTEISVKYNNLTSNYSYGIIYTPVYFGSGSSAAGHSWTSNDGYIGLRYAGNGDFNAGRMIIPRYSDTNNIKVGLFEMGMATNARTASMSMGAYNNGTAAITRLDFGNANSFSPDSVISLYRLID